MSFSPLDSRLMGDLFTTEAMRAIYADGSLVSCMLEVEIALARAQARLGLVPDQLAPAVAAIRAEELDMTALARGTAKAGVPAIPFVKMVQSRLPVELEPFFHFGTTTQDILDTAFVLQARRALALVADDLRAIAGSLADLATRHRSTPCVGRTASQQAVPVTFGYKAAGWGVAAVEHLALLKELERRVLVVSLGGPVGTLGAFGDQGEELVSEFARELELGATAIAWHTQRGRIAELGSWLCILLGVLSKLATDVIALGATEVAEVAEPHEAGRGGSSAMPHKRNPISSILIMAAHSAATPHLAVLIGSMASLHERPVGAWHAEWHALPTLFGLCSGALREARGLSAGLQVFPHRMLRNLELTGGLLFSDAAAAVLSETLGRSRAHASVEELTADVLAGKASLRELLVHRYPTQADQLAEAFDLGRTTYASSLQTDQAVAYIRTLL